METTRRWRVAFGGSPKAFDSSPLENQAKIRHGGARHLNLPLRQ